MKKKILFIFIILSLLVFAASFNRKSFVCAATQCGGAGSDSHTWSTCNHNTSTNEWTCDPQTHYYSWSCGWHSDPKGDTYCSGPNHKSSQDCTINPDGTCTSGGGDEHVLPSSGCYTYDPTVPTATPGGPTPTNAPGGCTPACVDCLYGCTNGCCNPPPAASCADVNIHFTKVLMPKGTSDPIVNGQTMSWFDGEHRTSTANPFDWWMWGRYQRLNVCYQTTFSITVPVGYRVESVLTGGYMLPGQQIVTSGNSLGRTGPWPGNTWEGNWNVTWRYYQNDMTCELSPAAGFTLLATIPPDTRLYQFNSGVTTGTVGVIGRVNGSVASSNLQVYYARATPPYVWNVPTTTPPVFNPKQNGTPPPFSSNFGTSFDPSGLPAGDYKVVCNNVLPANNAIRCTGAFDSYTTVIPNASSNITCDAACANISRSCTSVGTDDNATNGKKYSTRCNLQDSTGCTERMNTGTLSCPGGHTGMWTHCRCVITGSQDCGPNSRIVVRVVQPTPIIGQIGVSFFEGQSLSSCTDTGRALPAVVAASFGTSTSCTAPNPPTGRFCSVSGSGNINATTSLTNLFVNPTPVNTTTYTTSLSALPANWLQCQPSSGGQTTNLNSTTTTGNVQFGITQNVGSWIQTLGGNVHGQTGNQTWSTPKSVVPPNPLNFFNISDSTRSIGLVSAHGSITCSDSMGGADTSCHSGATDWRAADYPITSDATANPTTYDHFDKLFPSKDPSWTGDLTSAFFLSYANGGIFQFSAGGFSVPSGGVTVPAGQKYIIFTTGNVMINGNIALGSGAFLAIFTDGTITVDQNVTAIEGIFLSRLDFITSGTNDIPLIVNGTVIASGVSNNRTFVNLALSQSTATVQFAFNPLLIVNLPDSLKRDASFSWKEVTK